MKSNFLSLNTKDFLRGFAMAIGGAVVQMIYDTIQKGSFVFDFTNIWHTALAAASAYLLKNLFTNSSDQTFTKEQKPTSINEAVTNITQPKI